MERVGPSEKRTTTSSNFAPPFARVDGLPGLLLGAGAGVDQDLGDPDLLGDRPGLLLPLVDEAEGVVGEVDLAVHLAPDDALDGRRPLQLVAELVGREARGLRAPLTNSSSDATLFCSLSRLICSSTSASVATMSSSRARSSRSASFSSSRRAAFRTSSRRASVEAGRGLPEGRLGPVVELALRDDAGVDVDEDPVDDLAGRREGREGEGSEEGGADEASERRHGAESSEKRAAPPT